MIMIMIMIMIIMILRKKLILIREEISETKIGDAVLNE